MMQVGAYPRPGMRVLGDLGPDGEGGEVLGDLPGLSRPCRVMFRVFYDDHVLPFLLYSDRIQFLANGQV